MGNGTYVIGTTYGVFTSSDGLNWAFQSVTLASTLNYIVDIVYADNKFVAASNNTKILTSSNETSWSSTDIYMGTIHLAMQRLSVML